MNCSLFDEINSFSLLEKSGETVSKEQEEILSLKKKKLRNFVKKIIVKQLYSKCMVFQIQTFQITSNQKSCELLFFDKPIDLITLSKEEKKKSGTITIRSTSFEHFNVTMD